MILKSGSFFRINKITHVLSVIEKEELIDLSQRNVHHKIIDAIDKKDFNILKHFEEASNFINSAVENGNILIHCAAGISRSAACLIAYYIKFWNKSIEEALEMIRLNWWVNPNPGFI